MKGLFFMFKRSAKEFKSPKCLAVTAMLIALNLVLKTFLSFQITANMKLGFGFLMLAAIGMLYGPCVGFAAGFITDLLGFIIKPSGAFDIRFTLIEATGALLYGLFLYNARNDKWLFTRAVVSKAVVVVICNLIMTTLTLSSLMGQGYWALLPSRVIFNLVQLPIDVALLALFLPMILKAYNSAFPNDRAEIESDEFQNTLFFNNNSYGKLLTFMFTLLLLFTCCLGFAGEELRNTDKDLKTQIKKQQAIIDDHQKTIDEMLKELEDLKEKLENVEIGTAE